MKIKMALVFALALALALGVSAAYAVDSTEVEIAKMQSFYTSLVESHFIPGEEALAWHDYQDYEGNNGTWYTLTDFMYVTVSQGDDGVKTYALGVLNAEVPDDTDADDLYALFILAISDQDMARQEANALVTTLHERMYRNGYYSLVSGMDLDGSASTAILSGSLTDSEAFLSVTQYPEDAPF